MKSRLILVQLKIRVGVLIANARIQADCEGDCVPVTSDHSGYAQYRCLVDRCKSPLRLNEARIISGGSVSFFYD